MGRAAGWSPRCATGKEEAGAKFADYFDFAEPFTKLPSHRILAMFRGEKEEVLDLGPGARDGRRPEGPSSYEGDHRPPLRHHRRTAVPATSGCDDTVRWAWRTRILVHLGVDLRLRLRTAAEDEAVAGVRREPA